MGNEANPSIGQVSKLVFDSDLEAIKVTSLFSTDAIGTFGVDFDWVGYDYDTANKVILRLRLGGSGGTLHKTITFTYNESTLYTPTVVEIA